MHLILSLIISYPYLIKFHDFMDNSQKDETSNEGATQGMTLCIISKLPSNPPANNQFLCKKICEIDLASTHGHVEYKQVQDWNYIILLYSYEYQCSCLHKYLFIYLFSMYNYYITIIFLPWILNIHKLCQNFSKLIFFNYSHNFIL